MRFFWLYRSNFKCPRFETTICTISMLVCIDDRMLPANLLSSEIYTYVSNKLTYCL